MLTLPSKQANQYTASKQLIAGSDFNNLLAQLNSEADGIIAGVGGTQALATQLKAAVNTIGTVTNANDSVKLPKGIPGLEIWIQNAGAGNSAQVFTYAAGTINNTDGAATGVALAGSLTGATLYKCMRIDPVNGDIWVSK